MICLFSNKFEAAFLTQQNVLRNKVFIIISIGYALLQLPDFLHHSHQLLSTRLYFRAFEFLFSCRFDSASLHSSIIKLFNTIHPMVLDCVFPNEFVFVVLFLGLLYFEPDDDVQFQLHPLGIVQPLF